MLEIDDLAFRYPGAGAAYRFAMRIAPGEIVGLVGASGAGKSTLLDLVAGFLVPEAGDIRLDGASLLGLAPEDRPVSILFQSDNLFEHLTAGANVAMGLGSRTRPDDPCVLRALAEMDLDGLARRRTAELSGGQKQRVALARTLLRDRPVLLLDEPFIGLDEKTAAPIRTLIARLVEQRKWHALLVSHQIEDIRALTTRLYRLEEGRLHPGESEG